MFTYQIKHGEDLTSEQIVKINKQLKVAKMKRLLFMKPNQSQVMFSDTMLAQTYFNKLKKLGIPAESINKTR